MEVNCASDFYCGLAEPQLVVWGGGEGGGGEGGGGEGKTLNTSFGPLKGLLKVWSG